MKDKTKDSGAQER
jgi:hypothetical protein